MLIDRFYVRILDGNKNEIKHLVVKTKSKLDLSNPGTFPAITEELREKIPVHSFGHDSCAPKYIELYEASLDGQQIEPLIDRELASEFVTASALSKTSFWH